MNKAKKESSWCELNLFIPADQAGLGKYSLGVVVFHPDPQAQQTDLWARRNILILL